VWSLLIQPALSFPAHKLADIERMPTQAALLGTLEQQWLANLATIRNNTTCNNKSYYTCEHNNL
jgi:hypothetical protein